MTDFTPRHLRVLRSLLGEPDAEIDEAEFLGQGWTNENFRVRRGIDQWALRVCRGTDPGSLARRRFELDVLNGPAAAFAPAVRAFQLPEGHLLTDFVPGRLLADAPPAPETLGAFAAQMHRSLGRLGRRYDPAARIEAHFDRARRAGREPAAVAVAALEALDLDVAATTGCHNDFNPWNVIAGPDRWYVFDWETAADHHPLFDLVCMFEGLGWGESERGRAVASYLEAAGGPIAGADQLRPFSVLFRLGEYAWAFAERAAGNERAELTMQIAASLEKIRALA